MKIALLGGAGYLGSVVNSELMSARQYGVNEVTVIDNLIYNKEYMPKNLWATDIFSEKKMSLGQYDRIVWMFDIDVPEFYTQPISEKYISRNLELFKDMCDTYGKAMLFITDSCEGVTVEPYRKLVRDKINYCNYYGGASIALPQLYGPSPRMRFDTSINMMFLSAYINGNITVERWLERFRTMSVGSAGKLVARSVICPAGTIAPYSYDYSVMNYAGILVKIFGNKIGMSLTDNWGDGQITPPIDSVELPLIHVSPENGLTLKDSFEYMLKAMGNGEIDDPTKDSYSNAKIITSYQSLAQFVGYIKTNFS